LLVRKLERTGEDRTPVKAHGKIDRIVFLGNKYIRMPLTRHFYEQDEVQAALFYAGSRRRPQETVFWCHELILSGWASDAIRILFESWLWNYGPFHVEWYEDAWERLSPAEITAEDILYCAHRLSQCKTKDHSLWKLLTLSAAHHSTLFDAVTPRSPPVFPSEDPKERFFVRALYQRKATSAWWAACYLTVSRYWELVEWYCNTVWMKEKEKEKENTQWMTRLRDYEPLLGYTSQAYDRAIRAVVLLRLCCPLSPRSGSASHNPPSLPDGPIGRRASRMYSIPMECLYGMTRRGRMPRTTSTVEGLNNVEKGIRGCPFWEEAMEPYQTEGRWTSDETMEQFYEAHFPDDIPDEWTRVEKEKSHGPGLYGGEALTLEGYGQRMFFSTTRLVWLRGKIPSMALSLTPFDDLLAMEPVLPPVSETSWKPVHKRRVVH
jgi:hypothetical protein